MFSCEFFEISKNTFSYKTPPVAASEWVVQKICKIYSSKKCTQRVNKINSEL